MGYAKSIAGWGARRALPNECFLRTPPIDTKREAHRVASLIETAAIEIAFEIVRLQARRPTSHRRSVTLANAVELGGLASVFGPARESHNASPHDNALPSHANRVTSREKTGQVKPISRYK